MSSDTTRRNRKRMTIQRQSTIAESISNEHIIKLEDLCAQLNTDFFDGLTTKAAKQALKRYDFNVYAKPKKSMRSGSFKNKLFAKPETNQNSWSKRDWNRVFNANCNDEYSVVRDGERVFIRRCEIVPGDIVCLQAKQIVPADMRVVEFTGELLVDNRIITGNTSELKSNSPTSNDFLLSQNMIFACSEIISGSCEAIVVKTGNATVFGELTQFAQKVRLPPQRHNSFSTLSSTSSGSCNSIGSNQPLSLDSQLDEVSSIASSS